MAPNAIIELDWGFLKNSAVIANTLREAAAAAEFERTATHDSRNVLRDCLGPDGHVDLDRPHAPLLMIGAEEDQITPVELNEKNAKAHADGAGSVTFKAFAQRSHYICAEPG